MYQLIKVLLCVLLQEVNRRNFFVEIKKHLIQVLILPLCIVFYIRMHLNQNTVYYLRSIHGENFHIFHGLLCNCESFLVNFCT